MKINISPIIKNHINTLYDAKNNKISIVDVLTFYVLPGVLFYPIYKNNILLDKDFYNVSITFFGIFIALLLNIEVAIFGIFTRKWSIEGKEIIKKDKFDERNKIIKEVDSNISYLTILCIFSLFYFIFVYCCVGGNVFNNICYISMVSAYLYLHFGLTLLMVVKRSHALFQREYNEK